MGSATSCSSCSGCTKHDELLEEQLDFAMAGVAEAVLGPPKRAIAMQGGGFRAQMSDLGLIAALLAVSKSSTLADSKVLNGFDTLSTCSGSSWFAASLIYSPTFVKLLEDMAQKPGSASDLFRDQWVEPLLAIAAEDKFFVKIVADILKPFAPGLGEDIELAGYVWKDGGSWQEAVATLLQTTAKINVKTTTMGSKPCSWADSKTWICNTTLIAPTTDEEAVNIWQHGAFRKSRATYELCDAAAPAGSVPAFMPARFSITLGGPEAGPLFFISPEGTSPDATLKYTGKDHGQTVCSESEGIQGFPRAKDTVGDIPIVGPVAASSAVAASLAVDARAADAIQRLNLVSWFSNAGGADSFAKATSLVKQVFDAKTVDQKVIDDFAKFQVRGLSDAGDSDGTGLLNAISASGGCEEVTVVLNQDYLDKLPPYLLRMFPGFSDGNLLEDGRPSASSDRLLFPQAGVFASPTAEALQDSFAQKKGFSEILPQKTANYLLGISVGSFQAVTNESKWFNILPDQTVKINVVVIAAKITIGQLEDLSNYGSLAQEIISAVLDQKDSDVVSKKLMPMFSAA